MTLKAKMFPKTTTDKIKWTSSNNKIVTVTKKGKVNAKGKGTTYVTATTTSGLIKQCKINVW